jgi:hypothetical protein
MVRRDAADDAAEARVRRPQKVRFDGWTEPRRRLFVEVLRATMNVRASARAAGLSAQTAHELRRRDAAFAREWELALEDAQIELRFRLMGEAVLGSEVRETLIEGSGRHAPVRRTRIRRFMPIGLMMRLAQASQMLVPPASLRPIGQQSLERIKAQIDAVRLRIGMAPLRLPEGMLDDGNEP